MSWKLNVTLVPSYTLSDGRGLRNLADLDDDVVAGFKGEVLVQPCGRDVQTHARALAVAVDELHRRGEVHHVQPLIE
jgi:hypothetical protein